jgi:hypothetical protein
MFSFNINRILFFVFSALLSMLEIGLARMAHRMTVGYSGFGNFRADPGLARLSAAMFIVYLIMAMLRGYLAWRRTQDSDGPKWILGAYVFCLISYAVLIANQVLHYDFGIAHLAAREHIVSMALIGLWFLILIRPTSDRSTAAPTDFDASGNSKKFEASAQLSQISSELSAHAGTLPVNGNAGQVSRRLGNIQNGARGQTGRPSSSGFGKRGLR